MEENIQYLRHLRGQSDKRKDDLLNHITSNYLDMICREIKATREKDPNLDNITVNLGEKSSSFTTGRIEDDLRRLTQMNIFLYNKTEQQCNSNSPGFLGYDPRHKCKDITTLIAELRW